MNEQQLAAVKQALEALTVLLDEWTPARQAQLKGMEAVTTLQSIISQAALDKKAENARELGLSYDPEHDTVDIADIIAGELKVSRGTAYDMMREALKEASPVQEPVAWQVHPFDYGIGHQGVYARTDRSEQVEMWKRKGWNVQPLYTTPPAAQPAPVQETVQHWCTYCQGHNAHNCQFNTTLPRVQTYVTNTTAPTPQPVPVKTYHDGKPWPVAPKPWVGLTDAEIEQEFGGIDEMLRDCVYRTEAKLKEKNT